MTATEHETDRKVSTFPLADQGYNISSVDKFTEEAYALIDNLSEAFKKAAGELAELKEANLTQEEEIARSVNMITLAEAEASEYVAKKKAEADQKLQEASDHYDSVLGSVTQEKETIEAEIERLRGTQRAMLDRLVALHRNELEALTAASEELAETEK